MLQSLNLGLAFIAGFLSTLQPCVLPLIPIVLGGAVYQNKYAPIYIGLGMVIFYTILGAITGFIEPFFGLEPYQLKTLGAFMMIFSGLIIIISPLITPFLGRYSEVINRLNERTINLSLVSPLGCILLGGVLSLIWAPCAGPMLASALTLLTARMMGDNSIGMIGILEGTILLGTYGLGAAFPLVSLAYATRSMFTRWKSDLNKIQNFLSKLLGGLFVLFGVLMLTGIITKFESFILSILPETWLRFVNSI
jgi:cytochrome c biogenesis protein CcdA